MLNGKTRRRSTALALTMALVVLLLHPGVGGTAWAYDINDTFAINGLLTGAGQCQEIARATGSTDCAPPPRSNGPRG